MFSFGGGGEGVKGAMGSIEKGLFQCPPPSGP